MDKLDPESFATFGAPSNTHHDPTKVFPTRIDYVLYRASEAGDSGPQWALSSSEIRREQGSTDASGSAKTALMTCFLECFPLF